MNHLERAINFILRGDSIKFKNILQESLQDRAAVLMEQIYRNTSQDLLKILNNTAESTQLNNPPIITEDVKISSVYHTKDGNVVQLSEEQVQSITKLYKNLNTSSKERLLKLLSESEQAINRIVNLAKIEESKNGKK